MYICSQSQLYCCIYSFHVLRIILYTKLSLQTLQQKCAMGGQNYHDRHIVACEIEIEIPDKMYCGHPPYS